MSDSPDDRRWEEDERGEGVADAAAFVPGALDLVEAMGRANWVAESPELHLLPHIESACGSLPLELVASGSNPYGVFDVELYWTGESFGIGEVRAAVFSLLGSFAEISSYVRQRRPSDTTLAYDFVTGFVDGDGDWRPHGHTVRVTVSGISP